MYKAVFLDLDGTLLDDEKNISKENIEAINYAISKGNFVYLCSGRPIDAIKKYWKKVNASRYIIYSNGAGIYDIQSNETIFSSNIDKNICLNIYNLALQNQLCVRLDTPYSRFITNKKFGLSTDIVITESIEDFMKNNDVLQISLIDNTSKNIEKFINYINNINFYSVQIEDIFITGKNNNFYALNIINKSASKGNAISRIMQIFENKSQ